jgi:hypothetical protein
MVRPKRHINTFLFLGFLCLLAGSSFAFLASAQGVTYGVTHEWAQVEISHDGNLNVFYNITFQYLSGSPQGIFTLGMPKAGYQIQAVEDLAGNSLGYTSSVYTPIGIDITLKKPIILNQPIRFLVYATVPNMVFPDDTNPGNVGMQFFPSTFEGSMGTEDLRLEIILPVGVQTNEVIYPTDLPFDNVFLTEDNRTAVYWERPTWQTGQPFAAGVSFPETYVSPEPTTTPNPTPQNGTGIPDIFTIIFGAGAFFVVAAIIVAALIALSKATYTKPQISVEALGANRTLTAVEAGLVLEQKPVRVLTMILYGLILKRLVRVVQTEPLLKLEKTQKLPEGTPVQPRYYEIDYLSAIKPDGTLNEKTLALTYQGLVTTVNQRLRGYSREDTAKYYKSIVDAAWKQVTNAQTPELKGDALNQNIDWLLSDQKFDDQFKTMFPPGTGITPNPSWWWYWNIPRSPSGPAYPSTTTPSTPTIPSTPTTPTTLPGQDFANTVVLNIQSASNNMVKNIQDFANKLVPFQSPPSNKTINRQSCVCACHSCACACACVSCACACAGGGAH